MPSIHAAINTTAVWTDGPVDLDSRRAWIRARREAGYPVLVAMLDAGALSAPLTKRYEGWASPEGRAILGGQRSLADLADRALGSGFDPQPRSGRQEYLESLVNRYV